MSDTAKRDAVREEFYARYQHGRRILPALAAVRDAMADEIVRLRAENAALRAAIERVLALHYDRDVSDELHHVCRECEQAHPCPTLRALEGTP